MKIRSVTATQISDFRGQSAVEAEVILQSGGRGRGWAPSGTATGQSATREFQKGNAKPIRGQSVPQAIETIEQRIAPAILDRDAADQRTLDGMLEALDDTADKSRSGANPFLAVSMATAAAAANGREIPLYVALGDGVTLPFPEIFVFGGGARADWRTDVQSFLLMPTGATTHTEAREIISPVYHAVGEILRERGALCELDDEDGYQPDFRSHEEAFEVLLRAIERAGYTPGVEVGLSLDIAASDLFDMRSGQYRLRLENRTFDRETFADLLMGWCKKYPIVSLEDPMAASDPAGWKNIRQAIGDRVQIVGDELFATDAARIRDGMSAHLANSVLIKLSQVGTVTEAIDIIGLTQSADWSPVVSAASDATDGAFIAHLAVATDAGQLKVGSFARSEYMATSGEIPGIARSLGDRAKFVRPAVLAGAGRAAS